MTLRRIRADRNGRWWILTGFCDDVVIEDNVTTRSVAEHGIYHGNSADRPIIRPNVVWGNRGNGIHVNADQSQGGDGEITGALIERNVIYDNGGGGGSGINCDGVSDSIIRNNLLYLSRASGISLYRLDGAEPSRRNLVVNNTVIMSSAGRWALNIADGSTDNTALNNVLLTYHSFRGSIVISADSRAGFRSDYNVVTPQLSPDGDGTDGGTITSRSGGCGCGAAARPLRDRGGAAVDLRPKAALRAPAIRKLVESGSAGSILRPGDGNALIHTCRSESPWRRLLPRPLPPAAAGEGAEEDRRAPARGPGRRGAGRARARR